MSVPVENEEEGADPSMATSELSDNTNEDVATLRKEGYRVDENNDPAPEISPHLLQRMTSLRILIRDPDQIYNIDNQRGTSTICQRY